MSLLLAASFSQLMTPALHDDHASQPSASCFSYHQPRFTDARCCQQQQHMLRSCSPRVQNVWRTRWLWRLLLARARLMHHQCSTSSVVLLHQLQSRDQRRCLSRGGRHQASPNSSLLHPLGPLLCSHQHHASHSPNCLWLLSDGRVLIFEAQADDAGTTLRQVASVEVDDDAVVSLCWSAGSISAAGDSECAANRFSAQVLNSALKM
jgi:hypothetical protein